MTTYITFTEKQRPAWLVWIADGSESYVYSVGTIEQDADATEGLDSGTILEHDATSDPYAGFYTYKPCTTGANADAILAEPVRLTDLISGDVNVRILVRGEAVVNSDLLTIDSAQLATALTALLNLNPPIINNVSGTTWVTQTA
jgi:hypothetical protein